MLAIVTKYAFDVFEVAEPDAEQLREICDPAYKGLAEPGDVLARAMDAMAELQELVIVDEEGGIIYDGSV